MVDTDDIKKEILSFDEMLSETMKKNIHYRSMRNFVLHFDEIKAEKARDRVTSLLKEYIQEVRERDYDFSGDESLQLARKYLSPLTDYFKEDAKFMTILKLKFVLVIGIVADGGLYLTGLSAIIRQVPVVTIGLLLYYLFILLIKKPEGRVCGIYY